MICEQVLLYKQNFFLEERYKNFIKQVNFANTHLNDISDFIVDKIIFKVYTYATIAIIFAYMVFLFIYWKV